MVAGLPPPLPTVPLGRPVQIVRAIDVVSISPPRLFAPLSVSAERPDLLTNIALWGLETPFHISSRRRGYYNEMATRLTTRKGYSKQLMEKVRLHTNDMKRTTPTSSDLTINHWPAWKMFYRWCKGDEKDPKAMFIPETIPLLAICLVSVVMTAFHFPAHATAIEAVDRTFSKG